MKRILFDLFADPWPGPSYTAELNDTIVVKHYSTATGDGSDLFLLKLWALHFGMEAYMALSCQSKLNDSIQPTP